MENWKRMLEHHLKSIERAQIYATKADWSTVSSVACDIRLKILEQHWNQFNETLNKLIIVKLPDYDLNAQFVKGEEAYLEAKAVLTARGREENLKLADQHMFIQKLEFIEHQGNTFKPAHSAQTSLHVFDQLGPQFLNMSMNESSSYSTYQDDSEHSSLLCSQHNQSVIHSSYKRRGDYCDNEQQSSKKQKFNFKDSIQFRS